MRGRDFRTDSNWDKPGDEWGAGYVFTAPGWDLRVIRGRATADVWLRVVRPGGSQIGSRRRRSGR